MMRKEPRSNTPCGRTEKTNDQKGPVVVAASKRPIFVLLLSLSLALLLPAKSTAQTGGGFTIYGDLKVDESKVTGLRPMNFQVTLQSQKLSVIGRQMVPKNGRFRFENLSSGTYYLVVLLENVELSNVRVRLNGVVGTDYSQDIAVERRAKQSK